MNELISVIVPIHNVAKYLPRCVDSLIHQSYNNIEIILIDDGSDDGSEKICDQYAQSDSRVKVIHQEYQGVSSARNVGVDSATSDYIIFLDSDDEAHPDYVGKLYKTLIENNLDIAQCCLVRCKNGKPYNMLEVKPDVRVFSGLEMQAKTYEKDRYYTMVVCGKLYKKKLFDGLRFPVGRIHEDTALIYRLYYNAERIGIIDDYLYLYHYNSESITERKNNISRLDGYYVLEEKYAFYKEHNMTDLANITANEFFSCTCAAFAQKKEGIENPTEYFKKLKWFYVNNRKTMLLSAQLKKPKKLFVYMSFVSISVLKLYGTILNKYKDIRVKRRNKNK